MFAAGARHNTCMAKVFKWLVFLALGLMVLLAVVFFALHRWVNTEGFEAARNARRALRISYHDGGYRLMGPVEGEGLGSLGLGLRLG